MSEQEKEWVLSPARPPHLVWRAAALTFEHVLGVKMVRREVFSPAFKSDDDFRGLGKLGTVAFVLKSRYEHAGDKKEN